MKSIRQRLPGYSVWNSSVIRPQRQILVNSSSLDRFVVPREVQEAKDALLREISYTQRGANTSTQQRGRIEEAQVVLETLQGDALDYSQLPGTWRLLYTTAPDVVGILEAERLPFFSVGDIYQQFTSSEEAVCRNIINLSVQPFLQDKSGVRLTVTTRYDILTPKRISLIFEKAKVSDLKISSILESLIAPALLPRGFPNMLLLQFLREAAVEVPLTTPSALMSSPARGGQYQLTYLDEDILIGRAFQGVFIFQRDVLM